MTDRLHLTPTNDSLLIDTPLFNHARSQPHQLEEYLPQVTTNCRVLSTNVFARYIWQSAEDAACEKCHSYARNLNELSSCASGPRSVVTHLSGHEKRSIMFWGGISQSSQQRRTCCVCQTRASVLREYIVERTNESNCGH